MSAIFLHRNHRLPLTAAILVFAIDINYVVDVRQLAAASPLWFPSLRRCSAM